eukprot:COSAG02_NODE_28396_length_590_cov_1.050916_2_plen_41_part_01
MPLARTALVAGEADVEEEDSPPTAQLIQRPAPPAPAASAPT